MYDTTNQYGFFINVNGKRVTEYSHTDGNVYLEGRQGTEYELELVNNSNERVVMIPSVDGLSVIDGKTAGLDSEGYVVNAYGTVKIPGWTLDKGSVAKFKFDNAKSSYTNRSGNGTNNVGALGAMVFREYQSYTALRSLDTSYTFYDPTFNSSGMTFGSSTKGIAGSISTTDAVHSSSTLISTNTASSGDENINFSASIGTGFGDAADFGTTSVDFKKRDEDYPDAMISMFYDSGKGLERKGIVLEHKTANIPSAFPKYDNSTSNSNGCTPPDDWQPVDRDALIDGLLDTLKTEKKRDTMYDLLKHVESEKLEQAFNDYKKLLKL